MVWEVSLLLLKVTACSLLQRWGQPLLALEDLFSKQSWLQVLVKQLAKWSRLPSTVNPHRHYSRRHHQLKELHRPLQGRLGLPLPLYRPPCLIAVKLGRKGVGDRFAWSTDLHHPTVHCTLVYSFVCYSF